MKCELTVAGAEAALAWGAAAAAVVVGVGTRVVALTPAFRLGTVVDCEAFPRLVLQVRCAGVRVRADIVKVLRMKQSGNTQCRQWGLKPSYHTFS